MKTPTRTPDWLVERIALGELPAEKLASARAALLAEPDGAARLAALERSTHETMAVHPPEQVTAEVRRRAEGLGRSEAARRSIARSTIRWGAPLLAVAAAVVLVVVTRPGAGPDDADRIKGLEPQLLIHRRSAAGATTLLHAGDSARPGDSLQVSYVSAGRSFGTIVSVDGAGAVTLHLPRQGGQAVALQPQGTATLPSSFELDAAPGFERFFLITSSSPFDVETVVRAVTLLAQDSARALTAPLQLPAGLAQTSFLVRKEFLQ